VLVVGGGSAGIAAATAAARAGARTMLVERMVAIGGAVDPAAIREVSEFGSWIAKGHTHVTPFHPEALKLVAQEILTEAGVDLLFHTTFVDALADAHGIRGVVVVNKAGLGIISVRVVIDASADGDVAAAAGAESMKGRPDDGRMQPATMFFRVGGVDDAAVAAWREEHERQHPGERLFECVVQAARARGEFPLPREYLNFYREPEPGVWRVNVTRVLGVDGTDPVSLTRAELEGRRQVWWLMQFMVGRCQGFARARLLEVGTQLGVRETRRIIGEYILTGQDVQEGRRFPDAIARGSYLIDIHDPTGTRTQMAEITSPSDRHA
ncbi:MAG: FAD-dependent oxidoreductase, partial [Armatimonadetes bacterium]|nr:FAD-dependent oxidoreductase [Armatimonadota bacterium]